MKKIIYSAVGRDGKAVDSFIEANSAREAVEILKSQGFASIRLHDDVMTALNRPDLEGLSAAEQKKVATFEIKVRQGAGLGTFLAEVVRKNWAIIAVGIGLGGWGHINDSNLAVTVGALLAASVFIVSLWGYRHVTNYDKLLRAETLGNNDEALKLIELLRNRMAAVPEMAFDLAVREACVLARGGDVESAVGIVEIWRARAGDLSPGLFESRVASIYHVCGRYDEVLEHMRIAYGKSEQSPSATVDLSLAEARLGDPKVAEELLDGLNEEELVSFGLPFVNWTRGASALRRNDANASSYLKDALSGFLELGQNPALWTSVAVCTGYYALAIHREAPEAASKLLQNVWSIVKVHGDAQLLKDIAEAMPSIEGET